MKKNNKNGGLGRIYKSDAEAHIIFGAVHFARLNDPGKDVIEIVEEVCRFYRLSISVEAARKSYYRMLNAYIGVNE